MGYRLLLQQENLETHIGEKSWNSLLDKLALAHTKDNPPLMANEVIRGWVSQMGPCYPSLDLSKTYLRITTMANHLAFDEIPLEEEIQTLWETAHTQWVECREEKVGQKV